MANQIIDGDLTTPQPIGTPRISLPFSGKGDQSTLVYEQDFIQIASLFVPLSANSIHPTISNAYLVLESDLRPINLAGVAMWTRRYAVIPQTRNEGGSIAYQFPGLTVIGSNATLRIPYTWTVSCRVQLDYYLVGPNGAYSSVIQLPVIERQRYYLPGMAGGIGTDVDTLVSAASEIPTTPTTETYQSWISSGYEIVAEASIMSLWQGNIWQRATKYIIAR